MADKKISALTAASTPLAGTEVLPIVQSGATVQVSVANLTTGRAISATQITLTTGNVIVASGQGVDFSATAGTGTSELFADYEEGDWTPTGNGITFSSASGKYTKVGRLVTVNCTGRFPVTANTSDARFLGLPFTAGFAASGSMGYLNVVLTNGVYANINNAQTYIGLFDVNGNALQNAGMTNSFFTVTASYIV